MNLSTKSCMCLWSLMVGVGVLLVVFIGMMLFYSPGSSTGVPASNSHAVHSPE